MAVIPSPSYCGMLVKGLKYFAVGTFDPTASEHSVNKVQFVTHVISWFIMEMCLLGGYAVSFDESVLSFAMLGNLILSMSKFAMFSLNRSSLHKLIKFIDINAVFHTKTDVYVKKAIEDIAGTMKAYGFNAVFGGSAYIGGAIFFTKPENQKTAKRYWEVFHMYVPYDVVVFERIGVARLLMTIISLYHGYCQVFLDIVSVSLFTHVGWQFKATADLFKGVIYSEDHAESIRLKEVIGYHKLIFSTGYAKTLQKMYNGVFLVQLVGCCLPICFCLLLFVQNIKAAEGNFVDAISHMSFFTIFAFQLFLYTRCADLTEERAISVSEGFYLSDWHLASPSTRRALMWVLMNAQRPISYSAMGIFPMTVATFTQIMRGAYGVFSLMTGMD